MSFLRTIGDFLNGVNLRLEAHDSSCPKLRELNSIEKIYVSTPSLSIITTVGIVVAAIGTIALLAGTGNLPSGWSEALKINHISSSSLIVAGSVGVVVGGGLILIHAPMLGLKWYARSQRFPMSVGNRLTDLSMGKSHDSSVPSSSSNSSSMSSTAPRSNYLTQDNTESEKPPGSAPKDDE